MGAAFEAEANGVEAWREWASDHLAEADALPRARDIVELRQDQSLCARRRALQGVRGSAAWARTAVGRRNALRM